MTATKVRGDTQVLADTLTDAEINSAAAIASSKLADGANWLKKDGSVAATADLDLGSNKLTNVATPTADTDAAPKGYVDGLVEGLKGKGSVTVLSDVNVALTGEQTIDGVLTSANRVLLTAQSTASENGLWVTAAGAWARPDNFAAGSDAAAAYVWVQKGTTYNDQGWNCLDDTGSAVVDTDSLTWDQWSGAGSITAGTGLAKSGNTINAGAGDGITVNADDIAVNPDSTTGATVAPLSVVANGAGVKVDDSTIKHTAGTLAVPANGITETELNSSVAGTGIAGGGGTVLSVDAAAVAGTGLAGSGAVVNLQSVDDEVPSGLINGSNVTYTLTQTPVLLFLFLNGVKMHSGAGNDFTISGATITMATAPASGDKLTASFIY